MEALRAFCVKAEIPIVDIKMLLTHLSLIYRRKIRIGVGSQLMITIQLQGLWKNLIYMTKIA